MPRLQTNICTLLGGSSRLEHPTTRQCIKCYRGRRVRRSGASSGVDANPPPTSAMGAVFAQVSSLNASCGDNWQSPPRRRRCRHRRRGRDHRKNMIPPADVLANEAHHIFTKGQWRRADYQAFRRSCPTVAQTVITAMADTGAQSCLWSMTGLLAAGFTPSDLISVSIDLVAANKSPIKIAGAIILRLQGYSPDSEPFSCATMVYVSEASTTCHGKQ